MPSTAANAIIRSAKLAAVASHHFSAHFALRWTHGNVSIARRRCSFLFWSLMYVSIRSEYVSLWMFSTANLEAVEASSLWRRNFRREVSTQVLVDDPIGGGEKSKDV